VLDENYTPNKRFKMMTYDDMMELEKHKQSEATKRNTAWGMNVFHGILSY